MIKNVVHVQVQLLFCFNHPHHHRGHQAGPRDVEAGGRRHRGERQSFCRWKTGEAGKTGEQGKQVKTGKY